MIHLQPYFTLNFKLNYTLRLADNALILGHRLSEWCGHGPVLEQDIALANLALDQLGQARSLLQYAATLQGDGATEDTLAFFRNTNQFQNVLLVEQPNEDFAFTIARQFFFDAFNYFLYQKLKESNDPTLAAIAEKSLKEVTYHLRYSSEWMIRLGDGTEVSHQKIQTAVTELWSYSGELCKADDTDIEAWKQGFGVNLDEIRPLWQEKVSTILAQATLEVPPADAWMQSGGKQGRHSEYLGYLLAEMQSVQRAYPGLEW